MSFALKKMEEIVQYKILEKALVKIGEKTKALDSAWSKAKNKTLDKRSRKIPVKALESVQSTRKNARQTLGKAKLYSVSAFQHYRTTLLIIIDECGNNQSVHINLIHHFKAKFSNSIALQLQLT